MKPQQLKKIRINSGLTQIEFCEKLEISRRFLQYRENGAFPIPRWLGRAARDFAANPQREA